MKPCTDCGKPVPPERERFQKALCLECHPTRRCPKCNGLPYYPEIGACGSLECVKGAAVVAGREWSFAHDLVEVLESVRQTLTQKNAAYGDSALSPVRIFSRADSEEQIRTRLDDKLSRLARGDGSGNEDAEADALGYLVLLRIAKLRRERAISTPNATEKKE